VTFFAQIILFSSQLGSCRGNMKYTAAIKDISYSKRSYSFLYTAKIILHATHFPF
jgi:hypothetical protein